MSIEALPRPETLASLRAEAQSGHQHPLPFNDQPPEPREHATYNYDYFVDPERFLGSLPRKLEIAAHNNEEVASVSQGINDRDQANMLAQAAREAVALLEIDGRTASTEGVQEVEDWSPQDYVQFGMTHYFVAVIVDLPEPGQA